MQLKISHYFSIWLIFQKFHIKYFPKIVLILINFLIQLALMEDVDAGKAKIKL